jgi:hypothetical protein
VVAIALRWWPSVYGEAWEEGFRGRIGTAW